MGLLLGTLTWSGCGESNGPSDPPSAPAIEPVEATPPPSGPSPQETPPPPEHARAPGSVHWTVTESSPGRQDLVAMAADREQGFVVLGTSELPAHANAPAERMRTSLQLSRYDGSGKRSWSRTFTPEPSDSHPGDTHALALAVSSSGDLFVLGDVNGRLRLGEGVVEDSSFLLKLSAQGHPRWVLPQEGFLPQQRLAADGLGGVVMLRGLTVTRFDAEGERTWSWTSPVPAGFGAVAADARGGALVAGTKPVGMFDSRGLLVRLGEDGAERWRRELGPDGPSFNAAAIHTDGSLLLAGESLGRFQWGQDVLDTPCHPIGCYRGVFALSADAQGQPRWGRVLESNVLSGSEKPRLAVDAWGTAAVMWSHVEGSELERLSPTGERLWRRVYANGPGTCGSRILDTAFLQGGVLVGAGQFWNTCALSDTAPVTADETDLFLQRLTP